MHTCCNALRAAIATIKELASGKQYSSYEFNMRLSQYEHALYRAETHEQIQSELMNQATEKIMEMRSELESLRAFARSVNEALNSGDGTYRP